jgi:hypothetical protein
VKSYPCDCQATGRTAQWQLELRAQVGLCFVGAGERAGHSGVLLAEYLSHNIVIAAVGLRLPPQRIPSTPDESGLRAAPGESVSGVPATVLGSG